MIDAIPLPSRDGPFEREFWEFLDKGILAHQHCEACDRWHFPPRWRCSCHGALRYRPVSGNARLWSWTVIHPPVLPAFAPFAPYVVVIAELEEDPVLRMVGPAVLTPGDPINRVTADQLKIGMPLRAVITPLAPDVAWPAWQILPHRNSETLHDNRL